MKKNVLNKLIFVLLLAGLLILLTTVISNAATSLSISTSKSSVSPGETFKVTVSAVGAGPVTTSVSNGSGGKTDFLDNSSYSFSCTAGSSGSVTIYASGTLGDYETGNEASKSASKTVQIVKPNSSSGGTSGSTSTQKPTTTTSEEKEKSKDSTLSVLSVNEGAITPEFKKDVKEYSVTIPYETSEVNVTATPTDSKATVAIEGNKDLKEGENIVTVKVTAENGSTSNYTIKVIRKRAPIALKSLVVKYKNQDGELIELLLNPEFSFDKLEYTLEDLEYWVERLEIDAVANIEGATIDIQGAENLQVGENNITIILKIAAEDINEGEEIKEETITYNIKVNKKEEPTLIAKISNWFKGLMGTVGTWYNQNTEKVILGALALCVVALLGLSIYIIIDYRKYKDVIAKLKNINEINKNEIQPEITEKTNNIEAIYNEKQETSNLNVNIDKKGKQKGGRRFLD